MAVQGLRLESATKMSLASLTKSFSFKQRKASSLLIWYDAPAGIGFYPQYQSITRLFAAVLGDEDPAWAAAVSVQTRNMPSPTLRQPGGFSEAQPQGQGTSSGM
jgi:hypothetical protein